MLRSKSQQKEPMKKQICLSCKLFKLVDQFGGKCRLQGSTHGTNDSYPTVALDHSCQHWADSGQNYFIRKGWLRAQQEKKEP